MVSWGPRIHSDRQDATWMYSYMFPVTKKSLAQINYICEDISLTIKYLLTFHRRSNYIQTVQFGASALLLLNWKKKRIKICLNMTYKSFQPTNTWCIRPVCRNASPDQSDAIPHLPSHNTVYQLQSSSCSQLGTVVDVLRQEIWTQRWLGTHDPIYTHNPKSTRTPVGINSQQGSTLVACEGL